MEKLGFRRWHRQLWGTGAHGPSTSNDLFFSTSLWSYTDYDGGSVSLSSGFLRSIQLPELVHFFHFTEENNEKKDFAQHTVTGIPIKDDTVAEN